VRAIASGATKVAVMAVAATAGFAGPPARSACGAPCPTGISADARLGELEPERRLEWIDAHLAQARHSALIWSWAWGVGIGASGVASLGVVPFVDHRDRVDWYTSAASAAVGVIPLAVAPLAVIRDARELHARRMAGPAAGDVCALLADAEERLVRDADDQRHQQAWWFHAGNVAFNTGVTLFLGLGFHHWTSGLINGAAGVVVGEALILTQPTRTIEDLRAYRAGDLATRGATGGPAVAWTYSSSL
jgi:hypothetical protein